ncbi:MAG: M16 family metallopeptidase, partial [Nannocystaceae bacterium]
MNSKRRTLHLFSGLACVGIAATTLGCAGSVTVVTENSGDAVAETAPTAVVWPDEAFRATQPEPGPAPTLKVPTAQSFTLDNGLTVVLVPHTLPVFSMSLEFPMGTAHESAKKAGTMGLCMDLLDEGTKSKDKVAFEIAQADAGLSLGSYAAREESGVFVRGLAEQLDSGVALVAEMMTAPGLRAEDLDRLKSDRKASLMQARASGRGAASRVMQTRMWGAGHPMATLSTEQSIDKVKLSDCKNVVKKLKPGGATLFITGQVDEAQVRAAFAAHLPNWKGKSESKRMDKPAKPVTGTIFVIDIPGAAQSSINVGFAGPLRTADDYEATNVASMVYGGGFTSRLNMNIREDKGYAYGARGGFS